MAIPRPVLIALLGLALCGAAFVATRGASDTGGAVNQTPVAAPKPSVHRPAGPATPSHKPVRSHAPAHHKPAKPAPATKPKAHTAKPATPAKPSSAAVATTKMAVVLAAIRRGDVVVFYVDKPGPADDTATRLAVDSLKGEKGVTVVPIGLNEVALYRPVLSTAGVSQLPAVLIARKGHPARLIQGFVDANTLRQTVADALR